MNPFKTEKFTQGIFTYQYSDDYGNRLAIYGATIDELERKIKMELGIDVFGKSPTLYDQINLYLEFKINCSTSTRKVYSSWLKHFKEDDLFIQPISRIKTTDIKRFLIKLKKDGYSSSTLTLIFSGLIKPALQLAVEDELINRNPAALSLPDVIPMDKQKRNALTQEQVTEFLDHINNPKNSAYHYRNAFILMLETGLRVSELCGLTVSNVNFETKELTVDKQLIKEPHTLRVDKLKTAAGYRTIPLSPAAEAALKEAIALMPKENPTIVDGVSGFIFLTRKNKPLDRYALSRKYKEVARKLGFENTTLHSLRHTFCSNFIRLGLNVKTVQYLMGHEKANVTLNIYAHVSKEDVKKEFLDVIPQSYSADLEPAETAL